MDFKGFNSLEIKAKSHLMKNPSSSGYGEICTQDVMKVEFMPLFWEEFWMKEYFILMKLKV